MSGRERCTSRERGQKRSRSARVAGGVALALVSALACAKPYFLAPSASGPALHRLLVLPLNFDLTPPNAWLDGLDAISREMKSYLAAAGHEVQTEPLRQAIEDWRDAMAAVGGIANAEGGIDPSRFHAARVEVVRRALARTPADAVVVGTVLARLAKVEGTAVRWDGVTRELQVEVRDRRHEYNTPSGHIKAASIRVEVFDPDGQLLFERMRGLEPLVSVSIDKDRFWVNDRSAPFSDPELVRDEVRTVFEPLIVGPEPKG